MSDAAHSSSHVCRPETGQIEGIVFYSSRSRSWVVTAVPPGGRARQQRMTVHYCPWCGRDLTDVVPAADATLAE